MWWHQRGWIQTGMQLYQVWNWVAGEELVPFPQTDVQEVPWLVWTTKQCHTKWEAECTHWGQNWCAACSKTYRNLHVSHRGDIKTLSHRQEGVQASSRYPIKWLSPRSKKCRLENVACANNRRSTRLSRLSEQVEHMPLNSEINRARNWQNLLRTYLKRSWMLHLVMLLNMLVSMLLMLCNKHLKPIKQRTISTCFHRLHGWPVSGIDNPICAWKPLI